MITVKYITGYKSEKGFVAVIGRYVNGELVSSHEGTGEDNKSAIADAYKNYRSSIEALSKVKNNFYILQ